MADADCCAGVTTPPNGDIRYNCAMVVTPLNGDIRYIRSGRCCLAYSVAQTLLGFATRHETLRVRLCHIAQTLLRIEIRGLDGMLCCVAQTFECLRPEHLSAECHTVLLRHS